jgi:hypothetical protein
MSKGLWGLPRGPFFLEVKMIYLVGVSTKALLTYHAIQPLERPNLLLSYARLSRDCGDFIFKHRGLIGSLISDSGTYTLNNNPNKFANIITLQGYRSYLQQIGCHFHFYFNFDEDFSRNGFGINLANQHMLEGLGLRPVPVVHDCYGSEIPYYLAHGYDLVAIGSGELENEDVSELYRIVNKLYSRGIKVHFLGCTDYQKLAYVPVYSADSSTWNQAASRGHLLYWNPLKSGIDKKDKICFVYNVPKKYMANHIDHHPHQGEVEAYLNQELGYSIPELKGSAGSLKRAVANIHYYVGLEKRIAAKHRELGFKFWV